MSKPRDLTGQRFGKLVVTERSKEKTKRRNYRWSCRCDCGKDKVVSGDHLTRGEISSCGCNRVNNLAGQRFGMLAVIKETPNRSTNGNIKWICICDCGQNKVVSSNYLLRGKTTSCGCKCPGVSVGQTFGLLTATRPTDERTKAKQVKWECKCQCGRTTLVDNGNLMSGARTSCGCKHFTDYDSLRFRSLWEVFWFMAAKSKHLCVEYEKHTLVVVIDGIRRKYTPDFWVEKWGVFVEVKGRQREISMMKLDRARRDGHRILLVTLFELEEWCGHKASLMYKTYSSGGLTAVNDLIRGG